MAPRSSKNCGGIKSPLEMATLIRIQLASCLRLCVLFNRNTKQNQDNVGLKEELGKHLIMAEELCFRDSQLFIIRRDQFLASNIEEKPWGGLTKAQQRNKVKGLEERVIR